MLKMFMKNKKGFTLVELMVVVVILGILVAIAVPVYNATTENAQARADAATLRTLQGVVSTYGANNNILPGSYSTDVDTYDAYVSGGWPDGYSVDANGVVTKDAPSED